MLYPTIYYLYTFQKTMTPYYYIKTFGCQMNHSDSERIETFLKKKGLESAQEKTKDASLIVFNTCGVRQMAEDRVYGQIHNIRKQESENNKRKIIILTGCLAHRKDVQKRLQKKVDLFTSIKDFSINTRKLLDLKYGTKKAPKNDTSLHYFHIEPENTNEFIGYVPIMTGCNNFCSYCVVPHARGREYSRPVEEILREIEKLLKKGSKHIILLGQNVNSYHGANDTQYATKNINFSRLLGKINSIPGKFWISFVSNHPKDVTDEMIETVAKCKKVCENFHLPPQAGNNKVLENMNRKYTIEDYLGIVGKVKAAFEKHKPGVPFSITGDIIVGFPGETNEQFMESAKVMKKIKYDMVYFGQFSPRPETAAWEMKDNVSKKEKQRREEYLNEILKKTCNANNKKYVGKIIEVLVEQVKSDKSESIEKEKNIYFGKTRTGKNVKIVTSKNDLIGKFVKVKITKANIWNLEACLKTEK